jgi:hypothetical protein
MFFFYDAHESFEQPDVCGGKFFKAGQLDLLTVYLFVSRDMYTEKTAQRVMKYVCSPGFPSAGCKMFPPGGRVPDVKFLNTGGCNALPG